MKTWRYLSVCSFAQLRATCIQTFALLPTLWGACDRTTRQSSHYADAVCVPRLTVTK